MITARYVSIATGEGLTHVLADDATAPPLYSRPLAAAVLFDVRSPGGARLQEPDALTAVRAVIDGGHARTVPIDLLAALLREYDLLLAVAAVSVDEPVFVLDVLEGAVASLKQQECAA